MGLATFSRGWGGLETFARTGLQIGLQIFNNIGPEFWGERIFYIL